MSSTPAKPNLEIDELQQQIQQVASRLGFGEAQYELIVASNNIVFRNPKDRIIARVAPSHMSPAAVNDSLIECRELEQTGVPVMLPLHNEAVELSAGCRVTFWPLAKANPSLNGHKLAKLAAQLHHAPPPTELKPWTPKQRIRQRLLSLEMGTRDGLPRELAEQLRGSLDRRLEALESAWRAADTSTAPLHGDFQHGNIVELDGRLMLCDLDEICSGPREVDLATIQMSCRHSLRPEYWDQFLVDYPDNYDRNLLEACFELQTIGVIIWQAGLWGSRPAARIECQRRFANLNNPNFRWRRTD